MDCKVHQFARRRGEEKYSTMPMAPLSPSHVAGRQRQEEAWHKAYFLQACDLRGTHLLRSFSVLSKDVTPNCHLVYSAHTVLQINMVFNRGSRYRVSLLAKCPWYIKWHWLQDGDEERSELSAICVEWAVAGGEKNVPRYQCILKSCNTAERLKL